MCSENWPIPEQIIIAIEKSITQQRGMGHDVIFELPMPMKTYFHVRIDPKTIPVVIFVQNGTDYGQLGCWDSNSGIQN